MKYIVLVSIPTKVEVEALNEEDAKNDAEKIKNSVSDNALNKLAKYVHKVLNFNNLDCGYDINKEKCRDCARRKIKKYEK